MVAKIGIEEELFTKQVLEQGLTVPELMKYWDCSKSTIHTRKIHWDLNNKSPNAQVRDNGDGTKTCKYCKLPKNLSEFYSNGYSTSGTKKLKSHCKVCEGVKKNIHYKELITSILEETGRSYSCEKCGYSKNTAALHFHHNQNEKNFNISSGMSYSRDKMKIEIGLCQVLCANCHTEVHYPQ